MRKTAAWLLFAASVAGLATPAAADCHCRAIGVVVNEGETVCISTPTGRKLARCEKSQNVSSWRFLEGICPSADMTLPEHAPVDQPPERLALGR